MYKILGTIETMNNYYNFNLLYEVRDKTLYELSDYDIRDILTDSEKLNINLYYTGWGEEKTVLEELEDERFPVVLEFDQNDLEDNYNRNGEINPTAYKISVKKLIESERIKKIQEYGLYYVVPFQSIDSDLKHSEIIEIKNERIQDGQEVLIRLEEDIYIGPYQVTKRKFDQAMVINTKLKKKKYILSGYDSKNIKIFKIRSEKYKLYENLTVASINNHEDVVYIDEIEDKTLMELFFDSVKSTAVIDGKIDVTDVEALVDKFGESILTGPEITSKIRNKRLTRINNYLTSESEADDAMKSMIEILSEQTVELFEQYKNTEDVRAIIEKITEISPELVESTQYTQAGQNKINELEREEEKLIQDIEELRMQYETEVHTEEQRESAVDNAGLLKQIEELNQQIEQLKSVDQLKDELKKIKKELEFEEWHKNQLNEENKKLEKKFVTGLDAINEKMYDTAIDGFIATKIAESSSKWMEKRSKFNYRRIIDEIDGLGIVDKGQDELVEYLVKMIQKVRPTYEKNMIINLAICFTQGFLTVLSGKPGCGKTSICNIFAEVMGLKKIGKLISEEEGVSAGRFISVSVERGWTSKRDLIGYYNPLTKAFDKSNKQIYDALEILNLEKQESLYKTPLYILLDEANLSPMEYYWADFMNLCDELSDDSIINLGGKAVFRIPENFRFMATINNDHTTESLSPRLVDRAWVITLPKTQYAIEDNEIKEEEIELISWASMKATFDVKGFDKVSYTDIKQKCDKVVKLFEEMNINISPRTYRAIMKYCNTGISLFEADSAGRSSEVIALDYAISQKMLTKISGYGDEYLEKLKKLQAHCENEAYMQSARIIKDIISRGNMQMKYYQFFN